MFGVHKRKTKEQWYKLYIEINKNDDAENNGGKLKINLSIEKEWLKVCHHRRWFGLLSQKCTVIFNFNCY